MAVQISGNDITVPRDGAFTRNVTIGGTLTYEDVTNIDSVGLITARAGVTLTGGNITLGDSGSSSDDRLVFGAGTDLSIYHNGSDSYIEDGGTGALVVKTNIFSVRNAADDEQLAKFTETGATELYHSNSKKFETTSSGAAITGNLTVDTNTLHVDSSNDRVGMGTATPATDVHTLSSSDHIITHQSGTSGADVRMNFRDNGSIDQGGIHYAFNGNSMRLRTAQGERLRIDSAGRILIGGTSAIIGSSSAFNEIVLTGKTRGAGITLQDVDANVRFQIRTDDDSSGTLGTLLNASTNHPIVIRTNNTERVSIGSSGIVRTPYSVAFSATGSADNLDIDAGDKIAFNNISGGGAAIGSNRTTYNSTNVFNTSTYAFTAPVAGLYLFTVSVYFRAVNGSVATQFVLAKNGVEISHSNHYILISAYAAEGLQPNASQILDLGAGDVITVHRRTAGQSGTSRLYMPHSYFSGCLIG